jgi:hypothetical protein
MVLNFTRHMEGFQTWSDGYALRDRTPQNSITPAYLVIHRARHGFVHGKYMVKKRMVCRVKYKLFISHVQAG